MKALAIAALVLCLGQAASAEEAPRPVRQIAPDRFQPNPIGDYGPTAAAPTVAPPSKERPLGGCDKAVPRNWLTCLRQTADLSNALVGDAEFRVTASLDQRTNLNPSLRRGMAKALADADVKWRALRDEECNQLALLEVAEATQVYEAQLICRIRHDSARIDDLDIDAVLGPDDEQLVYGVGIEPEIDIAGNT